MDGVSCQGFVLVLREVLNNKLTGSYLALVVVMFHANLALFERYETVRMMMFVCTKSLLCQTVVSKSRPTQFWLVLGLFILVTLSRYYFARSITPC